MWKWILILLVALCVLNLCSINMALYKFAPPEIDNIAYAAEAETAKSKLRTEYTVQPGDTLGKIADAIGITWQELWKLNPQIRDPNLIYPGQVIQILWAKKLEPPMSKEEKQQLLVKLMFRVSELEYIGRKDLAFIIEREKDNLSIHELDALPLQREILVKLNTNTRRYEIWVLADAVLKLCKDDTEFYRIVGLAWQESHFVNKRGKHGERSFYQFLPSTIKEHYKLDNIGLEIMLYELENNPYKATETALEMLRSYRWNWDLWNHGIDYEWHLNNKIYRVKQVFTGR